jgi:hypothetical protein
MVEKMEITRPGEPPPSPDNNKKWWIDVQRDPFAALPNPPQLNAADMERLKFRDKYGRPPRDEQFCVPVHPSPECGCEWCKPHFAAEPSPHYRTGSTYDRREAEPAEPMPDAWLPGFDPVPQDSAWQPGERDCVMRRDNLSEYEMILREQGADPVAHDIEREREAAWSERYAAAEARAADIMDRWRGRDYSAHRAVGMSVEGLALDARKRRLTNPAGAPGCKATGTDFRHVRGII